MEDEEAEGKHGDEEEKEEEDEDEEKETAVSVLGGFWSGYRMTRTQDGQWPKQLVPRTFQVAIWWGT